MIAPPPPRVEFFAYMLCDPRTGVVFYVGKGHGRRVRRHLDGNSHHTAVHARLAEIEKAGLSVQITEVPAVDEAHAFALERVLIEAFGRVDRGTGTLLNRTSGGQGSAGRKFTHSKETKQKIGEAIRGKKRGPKTRAAMSASSLARYVREGGASMRKALAARWPR